MSDEGVVQAPPIDVGLVRRLVEAQFPQWADLPVVAAVPQGWDNRSFRLGETLVVRLPSAGSYAAQVDKENRWLPFLAPPASLAGSCSGGAGRTRARIPVVVVGLPLDRRTARHDGPSFGSERVRDHAGGVPECVAEHRPCRWAATWTAQLLARWALTTYAEETLRAIDTLAGEIPREAVLAAWRDAAAARPARRTVMAARRRRGRQPARPRRPAGCRHRLRQLRGRRHGLRRSHRMDPACRGEPAGVSVSSRRRRSNLGPRPRLGTVEGPDHAGRLPRARSASS